MVGESLAKEVTGELRPKWQEEVSHVRSRGRATQGKVSCKDSSSGISAAQREGLCA